MAQYTQKAIIQSFQDMLRKMPFDKITVSAIVSNCEISSNTFYYHYRDIYDLLDTWLQGIWKKQFMDVMQEQSWPEALKNLMRVMKSNPDLVYHLSGSLSRERLERFVFESMGDIFYQIVCKEVGDVVVPEEMLRNLAEYNSYSLLGFFLKFLWNHMEVDIDEDVDKNSSIFKGNVQWVVKMHEKKDGTF